MKKCTYCGKEYPDHASSCPIDGQRLDSLAPDNPDARAEFPPGFVPKKNVGADVTQDLLAKFPPHSRTLPAIKKRISRISIHQSSKVLAVFYVVIGLLYIPIGVIMILAGEMVMGIVYVLMPFICGIIGYPFAALMCWIYNMVAKSVGGIEVTVEDGDHTLTYQATRGEPQRLERKPPKLS